MRRPANTGSVTSPREVTRNPDSYGWPPLMLPRVAARFTGLDRSTLHRAVTAGELRVVGRRGRARVYSRTDLEAFLRGEAPVGEHEAPTNTRNTSSSRRRSSGTSDAIARLRALGGKR